MFSGPQVGEKDAPTTGNVARLLASRRQIGEGVMGKVYRARDTKLDRDVVLKVLPDDVSVTDI